MNGRDRWALLLSARKRAGSESTRFESPGRWALTTRQRTSQSVTFRTVRGRDLP